MDVTMMVEHYLRANGFDGLYQADCCACLLDDLVPCGEITGACEAGYKDADGCGASCSVGGCDFHVGPSKPPEPAPDGSETVEEALENAQHLDMETCDERADETHCRHWWDAEGPCCACGSNPHDYAEPAADEGGECLAAGCVKGTIGSEHLVSHAPGCPNGAKEKK